MKSALQVFLNLVLVLSLSAAPVATALAAASSLSYAIGQEQGSIGLHGNSPVSAPCAATVDGCYCPDNTDCLHITATTPLALPAGLLEFTVTAGGLPVSGRQKSHTRLNLPPESPPPIA